MHRNLWSGNDGSLVAFDRNYQIRDLYWTYAGQEGHA
jgi:hypothetical protein